MCENAAHTAQPATEPSDGLRVGSVSSTARPWPGISIRNQAWSITRASISTCCRSPIAACEIRDDWFAEGNLFDPHQLTDAP